jgi:hypothetical protein
LSLSLASFVQRSLFVAVSLVASSAALAQAFNFNPGDIVVSVEGDGGNTGSYTDNQAAPFTLMQFAVNGTSSASAAGSLVLPQSSSGANYAFSGEYGSSSEGTLQLTGNGQYLTLMGYGVNATAFNANPSAYGPAGNVALGQSSSSLVPRVVALISSNGTVDTSTALTNVFNQNNPRSVYSANGTSFYVSGQGVKGDATGGVFYATLGSTTATSITGLDAGASSSQDTREVQIYNGSLYVSADSKAGSPSRSLIGTLGTSGTLPTGVANNGTGPAALPGINGTLTLTAADANTVNTGSIGKTINLSPENYFFANATTLYVADSGAPKIGSSSGDGGLQKWVLQNGTWNLAYTLSQGLNLVANTGSSGTTGLYGLTGTVVNGEVELFATNYTLGDTDQTYLFGISDQLSATSAQAGESFTTLETAPADANFKGVSFAPVSPTPLPGSAILLLSGIGLAGLFAVRRNRGLSGVPSGSAMA